MSLVQYIMKEDSILMDAVNKASFVTLKVDVCGRWEKKTNNPDEDPI